VTHQVDPIPFANFIVARMLKGLPNFPGVSRAVAETEIPIEGDDWYWADDNAKVLELLALPSVWRAHPEVVADVVRFVCAMCDGPLIYRRIAVPRLVIAETDGARGRFIHTFMNVSCDLDRGEVSLGMRFHDGRTARNALFGGNYVRFRHGDRVYTVDAEVGIHRTAIEPIEGGARLTWTSRIGVKQNRFLKAVTPIGELTYTCILRAESMFVDFQADFDIAEGVAVSDVALTFGLDELSHNDNYIRYEALAVAQPAGARDRRTATHRGRIDMPVNGASYWSVSQTSHTSGFAAAVHSLPRAPERVAAIKAKANASGQLHWAGSEHLFAGPRNGRLTAAERKIITSGGFYEDISLYEDALARHSALSDAGAPPTDLSVSYDYGAEINALARCLRALDGPEPPIAGPEAAALRERIGATLHSLLAAYDRYFVKPAHANPSAVFSRSISYVAFAHAEMFKLTGDPAQGDALQEICGLIASFERPNTGIDGEPQSGFVMGTEMDALPFVDCHAPCMLALVRAMDASGSDQWAEAIDRGLAAFCLDTQKFFFLGDRKIDVVCVDYQDPQGNRHRLETFWNFKAGLCLQLFGALRATRNPALQAVWARRRERTEMLELWMRARIDRSLRHHDDGVEILTSVLSAETNSETQPWVALGLVGEL
jgi:hypothetical protein